MISPEYRRRIFYFCGRLGISDEERRALQFSACGKESMSDMNNIDAEMVIAVLKSETKKRSTEPGKSAHRRAKGENVYNIISPEQRKKVVAMSMQLYGKFSQMNIDRFCSRQFGKPFRSISSDEARTLIEIQKKMLQRKLKGGRNETMQGNESH